MWSMRGHAWGHPRGTHSIGTHYTRVVMIRVPVCENKKDHNKLVPLHMNKVNVVNDQLENFIVMPEGVDNFVQWWATIQNTDQVKLRHSHAQHGMV